MDFDVDAETDRATLLSQDGDTEGAALLYKECLKRSPRHFHALANAAINETECGRVREAVELYEKALQVNPNWFDGHFNVGNLYAELGAEGESRALVAYQNAISIDDTCADLLCNLSICQKNAGRMGDAILSAKKAVRIDSHNPKFVSNLASLLYDSGDTDKALFFAKKARRLDNTDDMELLCFIAKMYIEKGQGSLALECYETIRTAPGLHLSSRLRYFSFSMSEMANSDALTVVSPVQILSTTQRLYATHSPEDYVGDRLFNTLLRGCLTKGAAGLNQSTALSSACETFLLNSGLDNPEQLAHKCLIHDNLESAGMLSVAPLTIVCSDGKQAFQTLEKLSTKPEHKESVWYLKNPSMQRGQGICILKLPVRCSSDLQGLEKYRKRLCLQKAVDPLLLDGRKFGIRMHILFVATQETCLSVYMCQDGILTKCFSPYVHSSTDQLTQITCTSVQRGQEGFNREYVKGPASLLWSDFTACLPLIESTVLSTAQAVKDRMVTRYPHSGEPSRIQLFGYDFIFTKEGIPVFIEANVAPQFQDAKTIPKLVPLIAKPLINGLPEALGLDIGADSLEFKHSSGRWKHIGAV